jgi:hypothetical protein
LEKLSLRPVRLFFTMIDMTHENDFPPLFDDMPPDEADEGHAAYARPVQEPDEPVLPSESPPQASASVDIDSALAALASLQDLAFQEEAYSDEEYAPLESVPDSDESLEFIAPAPATGEWEKVKPFPTPGAPVWSVPLTDSSRPPLLTLERGQVASIVPAVLLIAAGAWGVFLIASGSDFPVGQLPAFAMWSLGIVLLVLWASLGRRSDGSLFGGLTLMALGAAVGFLTQTETWGQNYPLLAAALGAACLISSVSIAAYRRWLLLFGIGLILGAMGLFVAMSQRLMPQIVTLVPVVLIAVILVPLVLRFLIPTLPARPTPPAELPAEVEVTDEAAPIESEAAEHGG